MVGASFSRDYSERRPDDSQAIHRIEKRSRKTPSSFGPDQNPQCLSVEETRLEHSGALRINGNEQLRKEESEVVPLCVPRDPCFRTEMPSSTHHSTSGPTSRLSLDNLSMFFCCLELPLL
ncbi:hypothetical protein Trydic_g23557 [Trypoxylus dichotomus]